MTTDICPNAGIEITPEMIEAGYAAIEPTLQNYPIADFSIRQMVEWALEAAFRCTEAHHRNKKILANLSASLRQSRSSARISLPPSLLCLATAMA